MNPFSSELFNEFIVDGDAGYRLANRSLHKVAGKDFSVFAIFPQRTWTVFIWILPDKDFCEVGHSALFVRLFQTPNLKIEKP